MAVTSPRPRIGELLVDAGVLGREQLERTLTLQADRGGKLGHLLIELGFVTEVQFTQVLGHQLAVPWVSLYHIDFSRQLLGLVPREVAEKFTLVPIFLRRVRNQGETLYVAMDDPTNDLALAIVGEAAGLPVRPMIAPPSEIRHAIHVYYTHAAETIPERLSSAPPPPIPPEALSEPPAIVPPVVAAPMPQSSPALSESALGERALSDSALGERALSDSAPSDSAPGERAPIGADGPDATPEIEAKVIPVPKRRRPGPGMVAITMLDGTTLHVPAIPKGRETRPEGATQLTARDMIGALRAMAQQASAPKEPPSTRDVAAAARPAGEEPATASAPPESAEHPPWEKLFAALLSLLIKKGLIADWEFVEELRAATGAGRDEPLARRSKWVQTERRARKAEVPPPPDSRVQDVEPAPDSSAPDSSAPASVASASTPSGEPTSIDPEPSPEP